jgi:hypothetical protein
MTTRIWVKLYLEILDDPMMGRLPNHLWRRAVECFLLAGRQGNDGALPPVEEMAWTLRLPEEKVLEDLRGLAEVGVVHEVGTGQWMVTHFAKRQAAIPVEERVRRFRARDGDVTKRYKKCNGAGVASSTSSSESNSDSLEEERVQGEGKPLELPRSPAEAVAHPDMQVFSAATEGRVPGMSQYRPVIETVRYLRAEKRMDDDALAAYLKPFWLAWTGRRRQDGRPYDRGNISWLTEWALNGVVPHSASVQEQADVIKAVARRKK